MRDPRRISAVLVALEHYWRRNPDLRLGQIVGNATRPGCDPYQMEEDTLLAQLEAWLDEAGT